MNSHGKRLAAAAVALLAVVASGAAADASVSLANRDTRDHKVTVIEDNGAKTSDHVVRPSQMLENICEKGCVIRLNDNQEDEYELEAGDKVSIEEGYLYYDEPENSQSSSPDAGAKPPAGLPAPSEPKKP
jgi:hypothetical protein